MLSRFFAGAFTTALCMSITLGFAMPRARWAELHALDWMVGLSVIGVTAVIVGLVVALCSLRFGRTRYLRSGRSAEKQFDPTDIIPFI